MRIPRSGMVMAIAAGIAWCWLALPAPDALAVAQPVSPTAISQLPAEPQTQPLVTMQEIYDALIRLPLAALLGTALALRPRRRGQPRRDALVVQTQIMLAVVGAVIMMVVGASIARAFGIVGAANLVRYRTNIEDPKDAVVMLCALAVGLAAGVGLYLLAPLATVFMALVLWIVEWFEPRARRRFELTVETKDTDAFRPRLEEVLKVFKLEFELYSSSDDRLTYDVTVPVDVRIRDVSDTIRLIDPEAETSVDWDDKKTKK